MPSDVGDVHSPYLIGSADFKLVRQIGIDPVVRMLFAGIGLTVERLNPHLLHYCGYMLSTHLFTIKFEEITEHARPTKG